MLFALIAILMFMGLYCFGLAMRRLWQLDWAATQLQFVPEEDATQSQFAPEEEEEEEPRLTKLGRPIVEIKLSA